MKLKAHSKWDKGIEAGTVKSMEEAAAAPVAFAPPIVADVLHPTKRLYLIFTSVGASIDRDAYYTPGEAREVLDAYVRKFELVNPDKKSHVLPNIDLCEALYKVTIDTRAFFQHTCTALT